MIIMKFGGTSVGSAERMLGLIDIVQRKLKDGPVVVVVSAMSGVTNMLEDAAVRAAGQDESFRQVVEAIARKHDECIGAIPFSPQVSSRLITLVREPLQRLGEICKGLFLIGDLTDKTRAHIMSYGELLSSQIITSAMEFKGLNPVWLDSRKLVVTDNDYLSAAVDFNATNQRIQETIDQQHSLWIVPGYISRSHSGENTTLGRGGSDYTAAIIAGALDAEVLEIWTDVNGVLSADPRLVKETITLPEMSYAEAMELSYFGAKVIYPPTIQPAMARDIPIRVKNTFNPDHPGTLVSRLPDSNAYFIKGLSSIRDIALMTISGTGMVGANGVGQRIFQTLAEAGINTFFITQSSSEHSICIGVTREDAIKAKHAITLKYIHELQAGFLDPIEVEYNLALVAVVGDRMRERPGLSGKIFSLLGENGINIRAIAQGGTERNISLIIHQDNLAKALNVLHEGFFLSRHKTIHLYLLGAGNVGAALISQLQEAQKNLLSSDRLDIRIAGLANSRRMILHPDGIDLQGWMTILEEKGEALDLHKWKEQIRLFNLRNSIMVDVTASEEVSSLYAETLAASVHVVTANKIAASAPYDQYRVLRHLAQEHHVKFLNETNVGAGLPLIKTIRDLILTGDRVHRIEAVLSGSLNYIFDRVGSDGCLFSVAVTEAREKGFTEPNPALDLSGKDVMRKILILSREAGHTFNMEDISNEPFLPKQVMESPDWPSMLSGLQSLDAGFEQERIALATEQKRWRYMATLDEHGATTGLQVIDEKHPAYHLKGTDNLVLLWTDRYAERPMVIAGAGAGPEVTASGILADIMTVANV